VHLHSVHLPAHNYNQPWNSVLESEPQQPELFALAEPETDCLQDHDIKWSDKIQKSKKNKKCNDSFLGNYAASNIKKARFCTKNFI
jgi:hypothetical protein